jgi:4-amino-4-deoxy-L-arabinose transferase-like glycosyltransferase
LLWIALLALPFYFLPLGVGSLDYGEGMYAEIAREMRLGGDWITPHLNGGRHFDKPPLLYWLIAVDQEILGETEFAARFWPALAGWAAILLVGAIGGSLYGARAGWLAALVYAASIGPFLYSRHALPESLLVFWTILAILGYVRGFVRGDGCGPWPWVMYGSFGFAFLTKSLVGMGLPAAVIGAHALWTGQWRRIVRSWRFPTGLALTAAIAAPWPLAAARINPDFTAYFFYREHVLRFLGRRFPRDEFLNLPEYLVISLAWLFPWVALVPQAAGRALRRWRRMPGDSSEELLLLLWAGLILGLFAISRSRTEYYALPALPALALLIGRLWSDALDAPAAAPPVRGIRWAVGLTAAVWIVLTATLAILAGPGRNWMFNAAMHWSGTTGWVGSPEQLALQDRIRLPLIAACLAVALCLGGAFLAIRRSRLHRVLGLLTGAAAMLFPLACWAFLLLEPLRSPRDIARILQASASPADVVVVQEPREMMWVGGIDYYSRRMVVILKNPRFDEVPLRRQPAARVVDDVGLADLWRSKARVFLVAEESRHPLPVLSRLHPCRLVRRVGEYVVFANFESVPGRSP